MTESKLERIYATARTIFPLALAERTTAKSFATLHDVDYMAAAEVAVRAADALETEVMGEHGHDA